MITGEYTEEFVHYDYNLNIGKNTSTIYSLTWTDCLDGQHLNPNESPKGTVSYILV